MDLNNLKVGILGGGQLGRMIVQSAIDFDINIYILDPDKHAPCANLVSNFSMGSITDYKDVYNFGRDKDIVTIEIENVNVEALRQLEKEGIKVHPSAEVIGLIQDKGLQKKFYKENKIPTSDFVLINNQNDINQYTDMFPVFQKLRKGGYDGKGVCYLKDQADIQKGFEGPSILEKKVNYKKEISVVCARSANGEIAVFPVVELVFDPKYNLVDYLFSPADINTKVEVQARELAEEILNKLNVVGTLAIEMFVLEDDAVLINEMAPRVHNSGHHTIEGNVTSQFEQHLRAICNFPLGDTSSISPAAMVNLIGDNNHKGEVTYEGLIELLAMPGIHPHIYGKKTTKPGRKMGHITIVDNDLQQMFNKVKQVKSKIKVRAN